MTKMTYAMAIDNAIAMFSHDGQIDAEDWETVEKLQALKTQLAKRSKNDGKMTKTQRENEEIKSRIMNYLEESSEGVQCKDLANVLEISGQKCSALLSQLVKEGFVEKYSEKRVTYFKAASADEN